MKNQYFCTFSISLKISLLLAQVASVPMCLSFLDQLGFVALKKIIFIGIAFEKDFNIVVSYE